MEPEIASLTSRQAQIALTNFYQSLPANLWTGDSKPNQGQIESAMIDIKIAASPEQRQKLAALQQPENEDARGAVAKFVLDECRQSGALRGYVDAAIDEAKKPQQVAVLAIVAGLSVVLHVTHLLAETEHHSEFASKVGKLAEATDALLLIAPFLP
jgi:hypothetical protein